MLDQNTDRSWWMIGAVVVGAALIAAAFKLFPEIFGTVTDKLEGEIGGAGSMKGS